MRAKRVINFSITGLLAAACSTLFKILVTIDSANTFCTLTLSIAEVFTQPDITSSPTLQRAGTGSPVTGEVSTKLSPSTTTPSKGILSPTRTSTTSPTFALVAGIVSTPPSSTRFTTSGRISIAAIIC